uniref:DH domain-containing protein n=1 Tax=Anopheles epiroticus TaxID=199890 RepID=A0A182P031_9DIPT
REDSGRWSICSDFERDSLPDVDDVCDTWNEFIYLRLSEENAKHLNSYNPDFEVTPFDECYQPAEASNTIISLRFTPYELHRILHGYDLTIDLSENEDDDAHSQSSHSTSDSDCVFVDALQQDHTEARITPSVDSLDEGVAFRDSPIESPEPHHLPNDIDIKISFLIEELLDTERNYINTLEKGIATYIDGVFNEQTPPELCGKKYHLFGNLQYIYRFHRNAFLPKLLTAGNDVEHIADAFVHFLDNDSFYGYILYSMYHPKSQRLCEQHIEFFRQHQQRHGDKLGVKSLILQPIQRLPRYQLLLTSLFKQLVKKPGAISRNTQLHKVCVAEKRLQTLIGIMNESVTINDIVQCEKAEDDEVELGFGVPKPAIVLKNQNHDNQVLFLYPKDNENVDHNKPINILHQGKFRSVFPVFIHDLRLKRQYQGRLFIFERCVIYAEQLDLKSLTYRGHYTHQEIEFDFTNRQMLKLSSRRHERLEIEVKVNIQNPGKTHLPDVMMAIKSIIDRRDQRESFAIDGSEALAALRDTFSCRNSSFRSSFSSTASDASFLSVFSGPLGTMEEEVAPSTHRTGSVLSECGSIEAMLHFQQHFERSLEECTNLYIRALPDDVAGQLEEMVEILDEMLRTQRAINQRLFEQEFERLSCDSDLQYLCYVFRDCFQRSEFDVFLRFVEHVKTVESMLMSFEQYSDSQAKVGAGGQALTIDAFLYLPIKYVNRCHQFFSVQWTQKEEDRTDTSEFKTVVLRYVHEQMALVQRRVNENYQIRQLIMDVEFLNEIGLVKHSEVVKLEGSYALFRLLLTKTGLLCMKISAEQHKVETYSSVTFYCPYTKLSARTSKRTGTVWYVYLDSRKTTLIFPSRHLRYLTIEQYNTLSAQMKQKEREKRRSAVSLRRPCPSVTESELRRSKPLLQFAQDIKRGWENNMSSLGVGSGVRGGGGGTTNNEDDVEEAIHQSYARPKKQTTHLRPAGDRASCDSGISLEDPALITTPANPPTLMRRPKGGNGGASYVRRLTQLFENLTHDELRQERERQEENLTMSSHTPSELQQVTEECTTPEVTEEGKRPGSPLRVDQCQVLPMCAIVESVAVESENHAPGEAPNDAEIAQDALAEASTDDRVMAMSVRASRGPAGKKRLSRRRQTMQRAEEGVGGGAGPRALSYITEQGDKMEQCDYDYMYDDDEFDTSEEEMEEVDGREAMEEKPGADRAVAESEGDFGEGTTAAVPVEISEAHNMHVPAAIDRGTPHYEEHDDFSSSSFDSDSDDGEPFAVRPDSNSSLKTARVTSILQELLANEANYVQTLGRGIENYVSIMTGKNLPPALRGQKYHIFGNIEKIHNLHQNQFLPMLESNRASIAGIAETFIWFLENDKFYCYIMFALNRPKSERICNRNLDFFQRRQQEVDDKLGLNSFLLQPIQRLPRYKLLLAEINKEILKQMEDTLLESVKDEIGILCKAEKRLERFIDIVNEAMSINDIQECYEGTASSIQMELLNQCLAISDLFSSPLHAPMVLILRPHQDYNPSKREPINLFSQGKFRKMFEVDIYDWDHRRRYPAKIFLFERSAIYAEKVKTHLEYRGRYDESEIGIHNENRNKVYLYARKRGLQEIEVTCSDMNEAQRLSTHVEKMMCEFAVNERDRINTLVRPRIPSVMTINRRSVTSMMSNNSGVNSMRESYESTSQTTWSTDKPIAQFATMQKNFCRILAANRRYYFNELPEELASMVAEFARVYDRILHFHTKRLYEDLSRADIGIDEVCELFIGYLKEGAFDVYNEYIRLFKSAAEVLKNIHKASRSSITDSMVAPTMDEFTFLSVQHWNKLEHFFQALVVQLSEQLNTGHMEHQDLFRKLAYVEVQVASFRKLLFQNYRLFNMDAKISPAKLGLVLYSDRVRYDNETISSHRVLLCERAVVCVKFQFVREFGRQTERYTGFAFIDRFGRDGPKMANVRVSKKSEVRLNVVQNEAKHPIDFGNTANRDKFYGHATLPRSTTANERVPPPVPRKPTKAAFTQKLQMTIGNDLAIPPRSNLQPILPSEHDRTHLSRWASAIAERIYDTVYDSTEDEDESAPDYTTRQRYYSITADAEDPPPAHETITQEDHIRKVIAELIEKEQTYIETLDQGIRNYVPAMHAQTLPAALRGQRNVIFINLEEILRIHRDHLLPDLERAASLSTSTPPRNSDQMAERVAEVFLRYIEDDQFYCYVEYAMHQADSEALRVRYNDYFLKIQHDLDDKLGLNSLLLQPIQRLPRYKLLLNEMVKDLLNDDDGKRTMSRRTALLCKVDKRISTLIDRVNQAINVHDIRQCSGSQVMTTSSIKHGSDVPLTLILQPEGNRNPINLLYQGRFQRLFVAEVYDTNVRRKYSGKLFIFEKLLLYVEIYRDRLEYRGHFADCEVNYLEEGKHRLILYAGARGTHEISVQLEKSGELQPLIALVHMMTKSVIYDSVAFDDPAASHGLEEEATQEEVPEQHPSDEAADSWDEQKLTVSLVEAQQQFLEVLKANRSFYLDTLSMEVKQKLTSFISAFEAIMELHRRILQDISQPLMNPDRICHCFDVYLKTDVFDPYFDYLREFRKATKLIQHCQTPSNFNNRVAPTVKQFTFLCIEHLQEYSRYFDVLIVKYSENSTLNIPINTELFQRLAYVLVHLNTYRNNLALNFELFLIEEQAPACGFVCYNERAVVANPPHPADAGPCRMFICERAAICVRIQYVQEHNQQEERFVRVLFIDRFQGRGAPMRTQKSKRQEQRLNFLMDGSKFRIDFETPHARTMFYKSYVNQYIRL